MTRPSALALAALAFAALACATLLPPRPPVTWDPAAEAVIVRATFCCGFVPIQVVENYIPDVTLYGDGRLTWTESAANGGRRVLTAQLTEAEMAAALQRVVDAGFFGWQSDYGDYSVTDLASQCFQVNLTSQSHQVCEYYSGAPAAFHTLYAFFTSGAGAAGTEVTPTRGFVLAHALPGFTAAAGQPLTRWPTEAAGFSLAEAAGGRWAEGEALAVAWAAANAGFTDGVLQEGDHYYQVTVQVPGLTQMAPP